MQMFGSSSHVVNSIVHWGSESAILGHFPDNFKKCAMTFKNHFPQTIPPFTFPVVPALAQDALFLTWVLSMSLTGPPSSGSSLPLPSSLGPQQHHNPQLQLQLPNFNFNSPTFFSPASCLQDLTQPRSQPFWLSPSYIHPALLWSSLGFRCHSLHFMGHGALKPISPVTILCIFPVPFLRRDRLSLTSTPRSPRAKEYAGV
jgi:hypothetical protein